MALSIGAPIPSARTRFRTFGAACLILAAGALAYFTSFPGIFAMDDAASVLDNASIRHLGDLGSVLRPPIDAGVGGRPFANLTFALNYAIGGLNPAGFHLGNVALHLVNALLWFGFMRRTFARLGSSLRNLAGPIALASALLWVVHPLTTSAVNYISQRTELLMACAYLTALYTFERSIDSRRATIWQALSVVACAIGMASKEVMVSAPFIVLLYDRTFIAGSFAEAWRQRRGYHAALAATWLLLAWLMVASSPGERGVGAHLGVSSLTYAFEQTRVLLTYICRSVWPYPLVFDYGPRFADPSGAAILLGVLWAAVGGWLAFATWQRRPYGFLGFTALIILAPTSSFVPIVQQPIAESRAYLPLAFGIAALATAVARVPGLRAFVPTTCAVLALGALTWQRGAVYRSEIALWTDTVARRPENSRASANLTQAYLRAGDPQAALRVAQAAAARLPDSAAAQQNFGVVLNALGRFDDARRQLERAVALHPESGDGWYNLGALLAQRGEFAEASRCLAEAVRIRPRHAAAHNNLSVVLLALGRTAEAITHATAAVALAPEFAEAHYNLGNARAQTGDRDGAFASFATAVRCDPRFAKPHHNAGVLCLQAGDVAAAIRHFEAALAIDPGYVSARKHLEIARQGRH